jgi:Flp pilus assembly protein TadD
MKPGRAEARVQAGMRLEAEGAGLRAEREYRAALQIFPRHVVALNNLGLLLAGRGRFVEAAPLFRRATLADPKDLVSRINLAAVQRELGDQADATAGFAEALALDPASGVARLNLANLLRSQGRLDAARPHYQRLLERDPADIQARWNLAALEGLAGDLEAAFSGFALVHARSPAEPCPNLPRWDASPLAGRRLLLEADQGLGDTLMFARLARRAAQMGGPVILRAQAELEPLIGGPEAPWRFARRDGPAPAADVWFPLVDLPVLAGLKPGEGSIWTGPYITAPPERREAWRRRLSPTSDLRVGLVWAGNPTHPDDRNRSLPLQMLLKPLAAMAGVELVSLQKGPRAQEADGTRLFRADLEIETFADTAAALCEIDLLVSVDTSVLHLAGAMGRPAWALLPYAPDWRWMLGRSDSAWYPTLELFRQLRPGDWAQVAAQVGTRLAERAATRR